jgi:transcriptional regulator GlxA family with amidase domain/YHS domain-containing protein
VFQDVVVHGRDEAFRLYTVAESTKPIRASGGMKIVPDYALEGAPQPRVVVVPAQSAPSPAVVTWLKKVAPSADVVMSVCTGSYVLAEAGLLDGLTATTHHGSYQHFENRFPRIQVLRGRRFVEHRKVATAGGLTSGIDLALRVVERYFGRPVAEATAWYMEYQSDGWRDATGGANAAYASGALPKGMAGCPVCGMAVAEGAIPLEHGGRTYSFCAASCRDAFRAHPESYVERSAK